MALAAPFLSSLREARGQDETPPKRLVIFFTHNGCITDKWWPALEDGALSADTFDGTTLGVLGPHYKKLLLPRGFRSMNQYVQGQTIDPHDQAMGSKLTCAKINEDRTRYATQESLDHTIAKQINPKGAAPLVLSVGAPSTSIKEVLSFSAPGVAFPAAVNPQAVYASLVGMPPSSKPATPGTPSGTSERPRWLKLGQSALDLVSRDLKRLKEQKMSRSDRKRIEDWQDLLRDTELGLPSGGDPRVCAVDAAPKLGITTETLTASSPTPASSGDTDPTGELAKAFTKGGDMMMNLMALSMLCDLNRSMILAYPGYVTFKWDDILHPYDHAGLSNRSGDLTTGTCGVTNVIQLLLQIDNWYAGKFARLVGLLDGLDEGNGTLLDNTATMWLPELSDGGAHNLNNLPILIAGSAGGYLKQGVVVNVEGKPIGLGNSSKSCPSDGTRGTYVNGGSTGGDVPINKLYVTLMNAVGCTQDGTPSSGKVTEFGQFDGFTADGGITSPGEVAALTSAG